jgi:hypothetical protein
VSQVCGSVPANDITSCADSVFNDIYAATSNWLNSKKEPNKLLALKILREFAKSDRVDAKRINDILTALTAFFHENSIEVYSEQTLETALSLLTVLTKSHPLLIRSETNSSANNAILARICAFLKCADSPTLQWASCAYLGEILSTASDEYIMRMSLVCPLKELCLSLSFQLRSKTLEPRLAEQAIKNLIFLLRKLNSDEEFGEVTEKIADVGWYEISRQPKETLKRLTIFKLSAACAMQSESHRLDALSKSFLPLIHREMSRKPSSDADELQSLAAEVGGVFKEKLGESKYNSAIAECQKKAMERSEMRKRKEKELAVVDPAAAVLKKQRKHEKKKEAKKRKLDELRPYRIFKRKRLAESRKRDS